MKQKMEFHFCNRASKEVVHYSWTTLPVLLRSSSTMKQAPKANLRLKELCAIAGVSLRGDYYFCSLGNCWKGRSEHNKTYLSGFELIFLPTKCMCGYAERCQRESRWRCMNTPVVMNLKRLQAHGINSTFTPVHSNHVQTNGCTA